MYGSFSNKHACKCGQLCMQNTLSTKSLYKKKKKLFTQTQTGIHTVTNIKTSMTLRESYARISWFSLSRAPCGHERLALATLMQGWLKKANVLVPELAYYSSSGHTLCVQRERCMFPFVWLLEKPLVGVWDGWGSDALSTTSVLCGNLRKTIK